MKKIITVLIFALLAISACFCLFSCKESDGEKNNITYTDTDLYWTTSSYNSTVYVLDSADFTEQELEVASSLQGIVAKTSAAIFIKDTENAMWLDICKEQYGISVINSADVWELVERFSSFITNGNYVLYDSTHDNGISYLNQTINYATVVSGAECYLMVPASLEQEARNVGLSLGKDVRNSSTREIFNEYKDRLNKALLIHQTPSKWQLRDYAIAAGAMCYYSDFYDGDSSVKADILAWANQNAPILGWTENETNFVTSNSLNSKITLAADWATNLSILSAFKGDEVFSQSKYEQRNITAEVGKHYLAILISDGDNLQWMENGFATDSKYFGSSYRGQFPVTWTVTPSMYNLAPQILGYLYNNATARDQFIAGPSGVGYINATDYNSESLCEYAQITASYAKNTGLEYINFLDSTVDADALAEFAKYDSIKGGVWSVGLKYIEGAGAVYWHNNKPFITVRETLWRIAGDDTSNRYYGFTERVAQRINTYSTDPSTIEGYTVLVCHAWSIGTMDYIARFVEQLDDHVELVTVGEMIDLVSKNVKHENVEYLNDTVPTDITDLCDVSSEQFNTTTLSGLVADSERTFILDSSNKNRTNYGWQFGNGGLQYDSSKFTDEGILLDGSDLNDVIDPLPNSWIVNKFDLGSDDCCLSIYARHASGSDVNYRVRVLQFIDGKLVANILSCNQYTESETNDFGWYRMADGSPSKYVYDLSNYIGKTVYISIEQDDTGDGSGEVITVERVIIGESVSASTSWDIEHLITDWSRQGTVVAHSEGLCLEYKENEASISNDIVITEQTKYMIISFRKFVRTGVQDNDPEVCVYVNGQSLVAMGQTGEIVTALTDNYVRFCYDLSAYIGQTITVKIASSGGQHACFNSVYLNATGLYDTATSWNTPKIIFDSWDKSGTVSLHNEGVCLEVPEEQLSESNEIIISSIKNHLTITQEKPFLSFSLRMFERPSGEPSDFQPKVYLKVNGQVVSPFGSRSGNCATAEGDEFETYCFNLYPYIGQNVEVIIGTTYGQHAAINRIWMVEDAVMFAGVTVREVLELDAIDGTQWTSGTAITKAWEYKGSISGGSNSITIRGGTSGIDYASVIYAKIPVEKDYVLKIDVCSGGIREAEFCVKVFNQGMICELKNDGKVWQTLNPLDESKVISYELNQYAGQEVVVFIGIKTGSAEISSVLLENNTSQ